MEMKMDLDCYLSKIKFLIENAWEGNIVLNEYNTEILLKFLEDRSDNSPGIQILNTPGFYDLISHSLKNLHEASNSVKIFVIKIVTILCKSYISRYDTYLYKNDRHFTKTLMQDFLALSTKICILNILPQNPVPNLHLACIQLATIQINIDLSLIIKHKVWKNIFYTTIHNKPKVISNAAYDFMGQLIWKLNENNLELELMEALGDIIKPILESEYYNVPVLDIETDTALADKIFSHLSALLAVMTECNNHACSNKINGLLREYFMVDHRFYDIFNTTKNERLLKVLNSCLYRYLLLTHQDLLFNGKTDEFCNKMTAFHRNYIGQATIKRHAILIIDYITQCTIVWSKFEKLHAGKFNIPLTFERNGQKLEYSLQIVVQLIMPMVKYSALYRIGNKMELTDEIELYIRKMATSLTDYIFSSCYVFGELLEEGGPTFRKKVTTHALIELLRLKGYITESQAGPLFQSVYYLLDIFIKREGSDIVVGNENLTDTDDLIMLTHLLNAMKMLLKEHNIRWYENLEVVCVQSNLLNLLKHSSLTKKHVIQVLDLINICIIKFLSPNMSLLVESKSTQENTLNDIGKVIRLYMQHEDWELRDSALNILNTCTEISFIKYIPLQEVIMKNNLLIFTAKVAMTDPEFYSRCTALKCLNAATKINAMWQDVLVDNPNIYLHLVDILRNHGEGMIRREAVNVLTGVYVHQKVSPSFQNSLYEVMLSAALDDLHWEVQLAALNFWKSAIHKYLTDRGMLDGKFPSVTFSKEKRKIIVLNEAEIQRQLNAIMNHLSNIGCLTVLLECMNELNTSLVMDQAYCIAKELINILNKYKFDKVTENVNRAPNMLTKNKLIYNDTAMDLLVNSNSNNEEDRYKVIDSIVNVNHIELVTNLINNYCKNKSEEMDIDLAYCSRRELVDPDKFLEHFRNNDYASIMESKNKSTDYVCTFDELLDEILES